MTKYVNTQVKKVETPITLIACIGVLVMLASLYVFFIASTVREALVVNRLEEKSDTLSSRIVDKEAKFAASTQDIDAVYAGLKGFREARPTEISYVEVAEGIAVLPSVIK